MTRDEVLKAVEIAAEEASAAAVGLKCTGQGRAFTWYSRQADLLRAAAELIRESGWTKLHDGLDRDTGLTCGMWEELPNGKYRWYVSPQQMTPAFAIRRGYTHYLPEPEPPAREGSKTI